LRINYGKLQTSLERRLKFTNMNIMFEAGEPEEKINELGFAKVATIEEIRKNGYVLTPGRYVGIKIEDDGIPFEKKMEEYSQQLQLLLKEEKRLTEKVREVFKALGWEV